MSIANARFATVELQDSQLSNCKIYSALAEFDSTEYALESLSTSKKRNR
jgi:hypothetical protein